MISPEKTSAVIGDGFLWCGVNLRAPGRRYTDYQMAQWCWRAGTCGLHPPGTTCAKACRIIGGDLHLPGKLRNMSGLSEERLTFLTVAFWPQAPRASLVNCEQGGITLPAIPGAFTSLLSPLAASLSQSPFWNWLGRFPPCPRICLHDIIANASPISPARPSEFSFSPP